MESQLNVLRSFNPCYSGITTVGREKLLSYDAEKRFQSLLFWNYHCGLIFNISYLNTVI